jgi:hypothetical protein
MPRLGVKKPIEWIAVTRRKISTQQESIRFAIKSDSHSFEVHEMRATTYLDVALSRTSAESVEQPTRILIRDDAIPFAPDYGHGSLYHRGVVTKFAMPSAQDIVEGPCGRRRSAAIGCKAGRNRRNNFNCGCGPGMRKCSSRGSSFGKSKRMATPLNARHDAGSARSGLYAGALSRFSVCGARRYGT